MRDSGTLEICNLTNEASNGEMPRETLTVVSKHWFEKRTIGVTRLYAARGVNEQIDLLVRIDLNPNVSIGQYAVLGNGAQYRITNVTEAQDSFERTRLVNSKYYNTVDITSLKFTELTLVKVEQNYDVNKIAPSV